MLPRVAVDKYLSNGKASGTHEIEWSTVFQRAVSQLATYADVRLVFMSAHSIAQGDFCKSAKISALPLARVDRGASILAGAVFSACCQAGIGRQFAGQSYTHFLVNGQQTLWQSETAAKQHRKS